jgi:hypothetical protein
MAARRRSLMISIQVGQGIYGRLGTVAKQVNGSLSDPLRNQLVFRGHGKSHRFSAGASHP